MLCFSSDRRNISAVPLFSIESLDPWWLIRQVVEWFSNHCLNSAESLSAFFFATHSWQTRDFTTKSKTSPVRTEIIKITPILDVCPLFCHVPSTVTATSATTSPCSLTWTLSGSFSNISRISFCPERFSSSCTAKSVALEISFVILLKLNFWTGGCKFKSAQSCFKPLCPIPLAKDANTERIFMS